MAATFSSACHFFYRSAVEPNPGEDHGVWLVDVNDRKLTLKQNNTDNDYQELLKTDLEQTKTQYRDVFMQASRFQSMDASD